MTPSEIADWLDGLALDEMIQDARLNQAAATIRKQAETLKIATEALEPLVASCEAEFCSDKTEGSSFTYGEPDESEVSYPSSNITFGQIRNARAALSRIKEVG